VCSSDLGGISGTGKSTLAFGLAPEIGRGAGAVVVRSDALRKMLFGVEQTERLPDAAYSKLWTDRTFRAMRRMAALCLDAGTSVVADAVHGTPSQRRSLAKVAADRDVPFEGLWLEADVDRAVERAEARQRDPTLKDVSDAGATVVRRMAGRLAPPGRGWRHVDANPGPEETLLAVRARLDGAAGTSNPQG